FFSAQPGLRNGAVRSMEHHVLVGLLIGRLSITEFSAKDFFSRFIQRRNRRSRLTSAALNGSRLRFFFLVSESFCPHCASCRTSCVVAPSAWRSRTWCARRSNQNLTRSMRGCLSCFWPWFNLSYEVGRGTSPGYISNGRREV